jgi:prepilin-type N-terminal cleavage/methylation domain-containing protein
VSKRRRSAGFSLIELVVAVLLASVVLMGSFSLMSTMVTADANAIRSGTVTAWSLAGINMMNTDIAGASALGYPLLGGADNSLVVCTKWFNKVTPPVEMMGATGTMDIISYCWDQDPVDLNTPFYNSFLRRVEPHAIGSGETCPTTPYPVTCNHASYSAVGGLYGTDTIVTTGVYLDPTVPAPNFIFTADSKMLNAVRLRYVVGNPAASAVSAGSNAGAVAGTPGLVNGTPVSVPFNTEIVLED